MQRIKGRGEPLFNDGILRDVAVSVSNSVG